ncbi:hypothetical protein D3C78_1856960 [compost metagenome]
MSSTLPGNGDLIIPVPLGSEGLAVLAVDGELSVGITAGSIFKVGVLVVFSCWLTSTS